MTRDTGGKRKFAAVLQSGHLLSICSATETRHSAFPFVLHLDTAAKFCSFLSPQADYTSFLGIGKQDEPGGRAEQSIG